MTRDEAIQRLVTYVSRSVKSKLRAQRGYASGIMVTKEEIEELLDALEVLDPPLPEPQTLNWDYTPGQRPPAPDGCAWVKLFRLGGEQTGYVKCDNLEMLNVLEGQATVLIRLPETKGNA